MAGRISSWHLHITGRVQGVGYRPLVYTIASRQGITGWVKNDLDGLHVYFNASKQQAQSFTQTITVQSKPQLAHIHSVELKSVPNLQCSGFQIIQETTGQQSIFSVTPDIALCEQCRQELRDDSNRRHQYPFISCCQCGPRYSIVNTLPYDRHATTMDSFPLCQTCECEYSDQNDRRFYAQTQSCQACGIQLQLYASSGEAISSELSEIIQLATQYWKEGKTVAIKGIGGFLLTCDAQNQEAIQTLRMRKQRPTKPLAIMLPRSDYYPMTRKDILAQQLLQNHVSPIVLIQKDLIGDQFDGVADGLDAIGVMIPYAPIFQVLLDEFKQAIVATSGNQRQQPISYRNEDALSDLKMIADYILTNDRDIVVPQDDSVIRLAPESLQKIILRKSRGLAPYCTQLLSEASQEAVLCLGAQLKSTVCLSYEDKLIVSQYIGNLEQYETQQRYINVLQHFLELLSIQPTLICADRHPDYFTSGYTAELAERWDIPVFTVQHHKAHFAAVLGEHDLVDAKEPILGVIWDGTGLGDDGMIWGGEFFKYEHHKMARCAHINYYDHILQDKMAKEPRIAALAICHSIDQDSSGLQAKFTSEEWRIYNVLVSKEKRLQSSSMGRLFDAVACVLNICDVQSYEGEAAMLLEVEARKHQGDNFKDQMEYYEHSELSASSFSAQVLLHLIIEDTRLGISTPHIAAKFHLTIVKWIYAVAQQENCHHLAFSGGVFQNAYLVDLLYAECRNNMVLYFHEELSPNDENISYGQNIYYRIQNKLKEKN